MNEEDEKGGGGGVRSLGNTLRETHVNGEITNLLDRPNKSNTETAGK